MVLLISMVSWSQKTIGKEVGDFSEIKVYDLIAIKLIKADQNKVSIKGENVDAVKVINDDGVLKIRMETGERFNGAETFVDLYYTSVKILDANEGAMIHSNEAITENTIELRTQEGGQIDVSLKSDKINVKCVSGGEISLSGSSSYQDITINSGGKFMGKDLRTKETVVSVTAGGVAEINASDLADVNVTAGGNVYVYGNPKDLQKKKFAGGKIRKMD